MIYEASPKPFEHNSPNRALFVLQALSFAPLFISLLRLAELAKRKVNHEDLVLVFSRMLSNNEVPGLYVLDSWLSMSRSPKRLTILMASSPMIAMILLECELQRCLVGSRRCIRRLCLAHRRTRQKVQAKENILSI
jgi:hypothetical protein